MAKKITSAKKCQRDTMILLFTSAITSAFAECQRELERLHGLNKKFFKAVEVSWNKDTVNILSRTHERKFPQENFSKAFVLQQ